jgi:hypothetical protein
MLANILPLLAQDGGFSAPTDIVGWIVWMAIAAVIVGLYVMIRRTHRRAQDEYWERKRREEQERKKRLGE